PSGDDEIARTRPFVPGFQDPSSTPVSTSYRRMFARGVSPVPAAAPAGRAEVNWPPAYARPPTTVCAQTIPSTWVVGRGSAVTGTVASAGVAAAATGASGATAAGAATGAAVSTAPADGATSAVATRAATVSPATRPTTRRRPGGAPRREPWTTVRLTSLFFMG